jgi:hypothetical protein
MRTWIAAAACMILGAALIFAIVHHHSNAAERTGGTARAADGIDSRHVVSPANAGGGTSSDSEHGWGPLRLTDW